MIDHYSDFKDMGDVQEALEMMRRAGWDKENILWVLGKMNFDD